MIAADFMTDPGGLLLGFRLSGHSGSAAQGEDIICAAVSSAAYMAAKTVSGVIHAQAEISACDGYMQVRVDERAAPRCQDVLEGLKLHLLGLEEQYPKNIKVSYVEV